MVGILYKFRNKKIFLSFCLVRLPTKFQTPRIILSGRSTVPMVVGGGWVGCVK